MRMIMGKVSRVPLFLTVAFCCSWIFLAAAQQAKLQAIECPFPEGQDVVSEAECAKYSACEWTDGRCHMVDSNRGGYMVVGDPVDTGRGFKVNLQKADSSVTLFGGDVTNLIFEVIYHEAYHVQVKIYDADNNRYEVPTILSLPESPEADPLYTVQVHSDGNPFMFNITRNSNGNVLFRSMGPLTFEDQFLQLHTWLASSYLYGFGENTHVSFRHVFEPRTTFPIFARDQPVGTEPMNEYGQHPYYMVMEDDDGNSHSVLLYNSNAMEYSTFLLDDGTPSLTLRTIGGIIDLHFFLGPYPEDINAQYANMVGNPAFPPYWALGFHLSRWGYNSTTGIREARERMRVMGIPQDVQTMDIDYMDRRRDFTYDHEAFEDLPDLIQELHNENLKVTLILDPALVIDFDNYPPAARGKDSDVFIKWSDSSLVPDDQEPGCGEYMIGYVWPDEKTIFPDFMKPDTISWWINELQLFHDDLAFDAIWIDMNEPANFGTNLEKPFDWPEELDPWSLKCPDNAVDLPPYPTMMIRVGDNQSKKISDHTICMSAKQTDGNYTYSHYDVHSLYGYSETVATFEGMLALFPKTRPVILSRSTFPGSGQYAIHWLGDNSADWEHMHMSIIGMFDFNMFGIPMVGADICGFLGEPDMEMCARWMELGAFYPFSRNHNTIGTADQDPGMWPEVSVISRDILLLRYKYLPYLYSLFHRAHMHGHSVVRPLLNVFPNDIKARDVDDQFFWGTGLMVAPVLTKGATDRDVYFPQGLWYDLIGATLAATGPQTKRVDAPLEVLPLYVRGGSILPWQEPALTTTESRLNPFGLTIALDADGNSYGEIFWDYGDEEHIMSETYMSFLTFEGNVLSNDIHHGQSLVADLRLESMAFYGYPSQPTDVTINGTSIPSSDWKFDGAINLLEVYVTLPLGDLFTLTITV